MILHSWTVKGTHAMCDLDPYLTNPLNFVNAPSAAGISHLSSKMLRGNKNRINLFFSFNQDQLYKFAQNIQKHMTAIV